MSQKRNDSSGGATLHASCVARDGHGVLLLGGSGSGKSDLALRLLDRGFRLVADDRVALVDGEAAPPAGLAGLLEVRGLGILRVEAVFPAKLALVVDLGAPGERLPAPASHPTLHLPLLHLSPWQHSAPLRVEIGLDCVLGRRALLAGFVAEDMQRAHFRPVTET